MLSMNQVTDTVAVNCKVDCWAFWKLLHFSLLFNHFNHQSLSM